MRGREGWKATERTLMSNFFLCAAISWRHTRFSMFQSRSEPSWLPDKRYNPFGSIAKEEIPSTCATVPWISLPATECTHFDTDVHARINLKWLLVRDTLRFNVFNT